MVFIALACSVSSLLVSPSSSGHATTHASERRRQQGGGGEHGGCHSVRFVTAVFGHVYHRDPRFPGFPFLARGFTLEPPRVFLCREV